MSETKKLSVLVVCYNQENYIKQAIESVLKQQTTFQFELVIADDCSSDATVSVVRSLLESSTIEYQILSSDHNLGLSLNYLRGFKTCNAAYIAVLEGDDYWVTTNHLQLHVDQLDKNPDCVLSINRKIIKNEINGQERDESWPYDTESIDIDTEMIIMYNHIGNFSCCVFRKSALDRIDPSMYVGGCADWMHGIVLSEMGNIIKMKTITTVYRMHSKGLWGGKSGTDQIRQLIHHTIPKMDAFLEYRQAHHFRQKTLSLEQEFEYANSYFHKLASLVPASVRYYIKKMLAFLPVFPKK
jgi:glycosyltransferase involved in cell wall biosynthesis